MAITPLRTMGAMGTMGGGHGAVCPAAGHGQGRSSGRTSSASGRAPSRRRLLLRVGQGALGGALLCPLLGTSVTPARGLTRLEEKFVDAMSASGEPERALKLWDQAIEMAPGNSAAWSNRGTLCLQAGRWQEARDNLAKARELDAVANPSGSPDPLVLNNLGNAEGALGNWDAALKLYGEASELNAPEIQAIANANMSLAYFQTGRVAEAIREARAVLRRDAQFLDMRVALTAYLWASSEEKAAEEEWEALQQAQDGLGAEIYSRSGSAMGYDGEVHEYQFRTFPAVNIGDTADSSQ